MIPAKVVYLNDEKTWLWVGGNTPWVEINEYGDVKKILTSSSTNINGR